MYARRLSEASRWDPHDGHLAGSPELPRERAGFRAGEHVVCTLNDRNLNIHDGTRGTVFHVDTAQRMLTIGVPDGGLRTLPATYPLGRASGQRLRHH